LEVGISFGTQSLKDDWAWRIPSLLQMVPSLVQIVFILYPFLHALFGTRMLTTITA
jgi:hypothetical protein